MLASIGPSSPSRAVQAELEAMSCGADGHRVPRKLAKTRRIFAEPRFLPGQDRDTRLKGVSENSQLVLIGAGVPRFKPNHGNFQRRLIDGPEIDARRIIQLQRSVPSMHVS